MSSNVSLSGRLEKAFSVSLVNGFLSILGLLLMQQSSRTFPKCFVCSNTAAFFVRMLSLKPSPSSHYAALSAVDLVKAAKKEHGGLLELVLLPTSLVLGDGTLVLSLTFQPGVFYPNNYVPSLLCLWNVYILERVSNGAPNLHSNRHC